MRYSSLLVVLGLLVVGACRGLAQFIDIRLSYKVVLNPANGLRPRGITDAQIDQAVDQMNRLHAGYGRGFRFVRVDPVTNVGGQGDTTGPSRWYSTDFFNEDYGTTWREQMESAARNNPTAYAWNAAALNLYFSDGICGGICSFPADNIIIVGACSAGDGGLQLHEIGHYFNLFHTQGRRCGRCGFDDCSGPESDEIGETLPDRSCWTWEDIARHSFPSFPNLTPSQSNQVNNTYNNVMSYHWPKSVLTEQQLDRWTDAASHARPGVCSGRTWFVRSGGCINPDGELNCTFVWNPFVHGYQGGPFSSVSSALDAARAGDIILLNPGTYRRSDAISQPVTLRATRSGPVTLVR